MQSLYKFIKCNAKDLIDKLHEQAKENKRKVKVKQKRIIPRRIKIFV